jgi:hypothetical protein
MNAKLDKKVSPPSKVGEMFQCLLIVLILSLEKGAVKFLIIWKS